MSEEGYHVGFAVSEIVYLSSMDDEENHVCDGISLLSHLRSLFYGDVDVNLLVESFDASLVLQYFCLLEPEGTSLPWEGWRIQIADVDGNDSVEAFDAGLILQYSLDLINIFPVEQQPLVNRRSRRIPQAQVSKIMPAIKTEESRTGNGTLNKSGGKHE
jgi:hypothetical protein